MAIETDPKSQDTLWEQLDAIQKEINEYAEDLAQQKNVLPEWEKIVTVESLTNRITTMCKDLKDPKDVEALQILLTTLNKDPSNLNTIHAIKEKIAEIDGNHRMSTYLNSLKQEPKEKENILNLLNTPAHELLQHLYDTNWDAKQLYTWCKDHKQDLQQQYKQYSRDKNPLWPLWKLIEMDYTNREEQEQWFRKKAQTAYDNSKNLNSRYEKDLKRKQNCINVYQGAPNEFLKTYNLVDDLYHIGDQGGTQKNDDRRYACRTRILADEGDKPQKNNKYSDEYNERERIREAVKEKVGNNKDDIFRWLFRHELACDHDMTKELKDTNKEQVLANLVNTWNKATDKLKIIRLWKNLDDRGGFQVNFDITADKYQTALTKLIEAKDQGDIEINQDALISITWEMYKDDPNIKDLLSKIYNKIWEVKFIQQAIWITTDILNGNSERLKQRDQSLWTIVDTRITQTKKKIIQ